MAFAFPKPEPRAKERKPWRRSKPIRARRPRREDRPGHDLARRDWCRRQPCVAARVFGRCFGAIDPHHAAKKSDEGARADNTTVPLCRGHHDQITGNVGGYGVFQALGRDGRRALQDEWIAATQARFLSHGGRRAT